MDQNANAAERAIICETKVGKVRQATVKTRVSGRVLFGWTFSWLLKCSSIQPSFIYAWLSWGYWPLNLLITLPISMMFTVALKKNLFLLIDFTFQLMLQLEDRAARGHEAVCHCNPQYPLSSRQSTLFASYLPNRQQSQLQNPHLSKSFHLASGFGFLLWLLQEKMGSGNFYSLLNNCAIGYPRSELSSDTLSAITTLIKMQ